MINNDYFLRITTLFKNSSDRVLDQLQLAYLDTDYLQSLISGLIEDKLTTELVLNKRVLLKPNWVKHNRKDHDASDELCLRTNDSILVALLVEVLKLNPASVLIGDAPVQGCKWEGVIRPPLIKKIDDVSKKFGIPVRIKDFRRVTFNSNNNMLNEELNPFSEYIIFDVGEKSFLEPISKVGKPGFRVTDYNPDRLAESHGPGKHKYCITKELFDNDIVISIPKVKTHQKAGITNALKNLVGVNGDKDYLPHHRKGGSDAGGDCYPDSNILRNWSESVLDHANRYRGKWHYKFWRRFPSLLWRISRPTPKHNIAAAWHGNDTTWRMVLDLNLIVEYGTRDGKISDTRQRVLFSLSDGIIGGQGDGPLQPEPLPLGVLSFSNHSVSTDIAMTYLMGYDYKKIPLVATLSDRVLNDNVTISLDKKNIDLSELGKYSVKTKPPPGWAGYLN